MSKRGENEVEKRCTLIDFVSPKCTGSITKGHQTGERVDSVVRQLRGEKESAYHTQDGERTIMQTKLQILYGLEIGFSKRVTL